MKTFNRREYDKQANKKSLVELFERHKEVLKEIENGNNSEHLYYEEDYLNRCLNDRANKELLQEELKQLEEKKGMVKMNSISLRHFERFYRHLLNGYGYYLLDGEMHITKNGDIIATFRTLKGIVDFLNVKTVKM